VLHRLEELEKTNLSRLPERNAIDSEDDRKPRTKEEMQVESEMLRKMFAGISLPLPM
jgi:hypothetical protein